MHSPHMTWEWAGHAGGVELQITMCCPVSHGVSRRRAWQLCQPNLANGKKLNGLHSSCGGHKSLSWHSVVEWSEPTELKRRRRLEEWISGKFSSYIQLNCPWNVTSTPCPLLALLQCHSATWLGWLQRMHLMHSTLGNLSRLSPTFILCQLTPVDHSRIFPNFHWSFANWNRCSNHIELTLD